MPATRSAPPDVAEAIAAVFARRDRVLAAVLTAIGGTPLDSAAADRAAAAAVRELPARCRYDAVYRSLTALVVPPTSLAPVDPTTLRAWAWALAGNVPALRAGTAVYPPALPGRPTRVPVQVMAAHRFPDGRAAPGATPAGFRVRYRLLVLAGPGCPLTANVTWSSRYVAYLATHPHGPGFAGRRDLARPPRPGATARRRPYRHYATLVGMRLSVELSVDPDGRPRAAHARCPAAFRAAAVALTAMRWRDGFACPFSFAHPCHQCPKGQASCPAACRPADLVDRPCVGCGRTAPFDPYWADRVCVRCAQLGKKPPP